ncbi:MAG: type III toxin-antitoxin system ToxN/AbiQ family toxin [Treponema sp.]|nr:type III toxin-antitoxin system ToxN/AbiQ family toxin [Treponema sp.]
MESLKSLTVSNISFRFHLQNQKTTQKNGKPKFDTLIKVYMKDSKRLYETLRFNNMIPVPESEIVAYDLNKEGLCLK